MRHPSPGFTLLELIVALAIAGALLFLGAPGMGSVIAERELDDRADALIHTLDRARSEAIKRGTRVHVCPLASGDCPGAAAGWEAGWAIATDGASSPAIAPERRAPDGVTIRGNRPVADYVSYTSMGLAVIEAMLTGMPVAALATTEVATVIRDGENGVAHTDLEHLVDGMKRLLADRAEARRLGARGQETARERFGMRRFVADWNAAFQEISDERRVA